MRTRTSLRPRKSRTRNSALRTRRARSREAHRGGSVRWPDLSLLVRDSWSLLVRGAGRLVVDFFEIEAPELVLGAVKEDAEVIAVDAHLGADLVLRSLVDEDGTEDPRVLVGQMGEDFAHRGR